MGWWLSATTSTISRCWRRPASAWPWGTPTPTSRPGRTWSPGRTTRAGWRRSSGRSSWRMPGGAVAEDLLPLLRAIFTEVRAFLLGAGRGHLETVRMNPRGDVSKAFDLEAEERIIAGLREGLAEPVRVLTEERG